MYQHPDSIAAHRADSTHMTQTAHPAGTLSSTEVPQWQQEEEATVHADTTIHKQKSTTTTQWVTLEEVLNTSAQKATDSVATSNRTPFYHESFFSGNPYLHPELRGGRKGVAGDPIPYTIANDNLITGLLLGSFIFAMIAFANSHLYIARQIKNFFHIQRGKVTEMNETSSELRFQFFLVIQTCLLLAIIYFLYKHAPGDDTFVIEQYQIIGLYVAHIALYFLIKALLYWITGNTFFNRQQTIQWMKSLLFIIAAEGAFLFPAVMLMTYFSLTIKIAIIYTILVVTATKCLSLYKTYIIFFRHRNAFFQNILYFCALEITPLFALWGILGVVDNYLKINY